MNYKTSLFKIATTIGFCFFGMSTTNAQNLEVNIMTGGASGTYIQFGRDIAQLAASAGRDNVLVVESAGSMENIMAVKNRSHTQFGIVQSDVLDFIRTFRSEDATMRSILRNTRFVFPLYKEEVHIVTTKNTGINTLVDLAGKIVGIGATNSGSNLTSTFLLEVANIRAGQVVEIAARDALSELVNGQIDAFIYVAGAPTNLLFDTSAAAGLKLVEIPGEIAGDYYTITTIKAGTYPWLTEDVTTAAVRAVLMTYEYDPARNAYFEQSCDAVSEITHLINANLEELRVNGHPKWNQVELGDIPSGWEQSKCVQTGLSPEYLPPERGETIALSFDADCSAIENPVAKRLCLMRS